MVKRANSKIVTQTIHCKHPSQYASDKVLFGSSCTVESRGLCLIISETNNPASTPTLRSDCPGGWKEMGLNLNLKLSVFILLIAITIIFCVLKQTATPWMPSRKETVKKCVPLAPFELFLVSRSFLQWQTLCHALCVWAYRTVINTFAFRCGLLT